MSGVAAWIAPARTALVVIDIQVDFASPDGLLGRYGVDLGLAAPAVDAAAALVAVARDVGAPVVFVGLFTSLETDSPAWNERMRRRGGDPDSEAALCRVDQPGSAFHGPQPAQGELVVAKTRYSAFVGTGFDKRLKAMGVDTLVLCGLTTECCVAATAADAFDLDYHVFVAADACAAYEPDLHEVALKTMGLNTAILTDSVEVAKAWKEAA